MTSEHRHARLGLVNLGLSRSGDRIRLQAMCGPGLPVEFCRIPGNRCLTLAIDEAFSRSCSTYSVLSAIRDFDAAIETFSRVGAYQAQ